MKVAFCLGEQVTHFRNRGFCRKHCSPGPLRRSGIERKRDRLSDLGVGFFPTACSRTSISQYARSFSLNL
ncbi:hypothetical protein K443DRAFT_673157 [Laccaria amethystina LaAM-08-1]|uniref:Uncharacterized protein n=1 Tax=Laccaria amethystina LaAM-08-1 TaxID=1095629 RepID=A0A0C9XRE3_9AGAR|nr:hypothetical protein K443DRAFT_673157 [Laccaria amethystina LaAM-08-1]